MFVVGLRCANPTYKIIFGGAIPPYSMIFIAYFQSKIKSILFVNFVLIGLFY